MKTKILTNAVTDVEMRDAIKQLTKEMGALKERVAGLEKSGTSVETELQRAKAFKDMTKGELKSIAVELGLLTTDCNTKQDFVDLLEANNKK